MASKKEKLKFLISLKIKDNGVIKELRKEEEFTIAWEREVNSSKLVKFTENGKEYDVIVTIYWSKKGWFKDVVTEGRFELPPNASFWLLFGEENREKEVTKFTSLTFGRNSIREIKPLYWRWTGPSIIAVASFLVLGTILLFAKWKRKEKVYVRKISWTKFITILSFIVVVTAILLFLAEKYE
jgi:hypothetical protein